MKILIVHSSSELYGSDRSLLGFVTARSPSINVIVVLPEDGPLVELLTEAGAEVRIDEVCKIQRSMLSPRGGLKALSSAYSSIISIRHIVCTSKSIDVVYSNTMAVFGGALYAWLHGIPHVWHVREIISASPRLSNVFRLLARLFAHRLICNSKETMRWISTPATRDRCTVVWNGVETANSKGRRDVERARVGFLPTDVVFALVGRINAWKGQALLVDAFELLRKEGFTGIKLWIVGAAFAGQEHYEAALQSRINGSPFGADMVFEGFRADIDAVWEGADVVTVPSTEPEPFGRVAIEAMAFQLPVIAAAHGGLIDIVEHGVSGLLFEPCKPAALAAAMRELLVDPVRRQTMGAAAKRRQQEVFSVESYAMQVQEILRTTARQTGKVVA